MTPNERAKIIELIATHGEKFESYEDAARKLETIRGFKEEELQEVAIATGRDLSILRGARIMAQHCCEVIKWLNDKKLHPDPETLRSIIKEHRSSENYALDGDNLHFRLSNGASVLLINIRGWSKEQ